jgi:hypothetical protein
MMNLLLQFNNLNYTIYKKNDLIIIYKHLYNK